jgi:hypothetical protein
MSPLYELERGLEKPCQRSKIFAMKPSRKKTLARGMTAAAAYEEALSTAASKACRCLKAR